MMSILYIDGTPFEYEEIDLSYETAQILNKAKAKQLLLSFKEVLDNASVLFLLMHGTLLGAIREHDFIDHDIDLDVCVKDEKAFQRVIPKLAAKGVMLCRCAPRYMYSFIYDGVYIDVYIARKANVIWRWRYCIYMGYLFPKKYIYHSETISFLGTDFYVPYHPVNILKYWYGNTWNIPIKNAPSRDETKFMLVWRFVTEPLRKVIRPIRNQIRKNR